MTDVQVSDDEKERLLAEIGVEPSSVMIRREPPAVPAPPPPAELIPAPAPLPVPRPPSATFPRAPSGSHVRVPSGSFAAALPAPAPAPARAPSRLWTHRRLIAAVAMLTAGSAWTALWMASERPAAAGLALLGIAAGSWVALRPKKY